MVDRELSTCPTCGSRLFTSCSDTDGDIGGGIATCCFIPVHASAYDLAKHTLKTIADSGRFFSDMCADALDRINKLETGHEKPTL